MAWNRNDTAAPKKAVKGGGLSPAVKGIVAGAVVIVGALVAFFVISGGEKKPAKAVKEKKPAVIAEVKLAAAPTVVEAAKPSAEKPKAEKPKTDGTWLSKKVTRREVVTNGTMAVETIYTEDGKKHKYYHDTAKPVFDNASDQVLALVTADDPHGNAPPLPALGPGFENEFADSLKKEIVIDDNDSEAVKEVKERVKQARQAMLDAMGAGMSAQDVIAEHRKMVEENAAMRMDAVKGLREYLDKGDAEGAREYLETMNKALDQMGIMRIEMPRSREEIIAERRERAAANRAKKEKTK